MRPIGGRKAAAWPDLGDDQRGGAARQAQLRTVALPDPHMLGEFEHLAVPCDRGADVANREHGDDAGVGRRAVGQHVSDPSSPSRKWLSPSLRGPDCGHVDRLAYPQDLVRVDRPDAIAGAWSAAFAADRPVIVEAVTDPEVPPLPPHITFEQARALTSALRQATWAGGA